MVSQKANLGALPFLLYAHRSKMPRTPVVYAVLDEGGEVIYVGQTSNLWQRMKTHNLPFRDDYTVYWKEIKSTDRRLKVERQGVDRLKPKWNGGNVPLSIWYPKRGFGREV